MKALLVGSNFHNYVNSFAEAFERNGCEVKVYMPKVYWELSTLGRIHFKYTTLKRKLLKQSQQVYVKPKRIREKESENVWQVYETFEPDLVVDFSSYFLETSVLKKMNRSKNIIWIYDSVKRLPHLKNKYEYYDYVYYFEGSDSAYFDKNGIKSSFLPLCADDKVYHPVNEKKNIDISFVGNLSDQRIRFLLNIKENFPESVFKVYGRVPLFYTKLNPNGKSVKKYSDMFLNQYIAPQDANKLYAKSKICINVHNGQTKFGANMRLFEIMAAKGFQIVDHNDYIASQFENCVVTYRNENELIDIIKYYLEHDDERNVISEAGYRKVFESELFYHRAKQIIFDALGGKGQ